MPELKCKHAQNAAHVQVNHLDDTGQWVAELQITCDHCGKRFKFVGLPVGLNLQGAAVSFDGHTATLACHPEGEEPTKPSGVQGFSITTLDKGEKTDE